jgi:DNA sulfur modification protein DndC
MVVSELSTTRIAGQSLGDRYEEVLDVYFSDDRPWVIGYSGGKDSTAVLRLVYEAMMYGRRSDRRMTKPLFVVSSDTLVETPMVADLIGHTLARVQERAVLDGLRVSHQMVTPKQTDTFWVNLIGKGYPAPTRQFRWCTDRMKIEPVSGFICSQVAKFGEVVVVLGSRSSESSSRAQVMKKHKIEGSRLARHASLPNAFVFTPIEDWSADDVWEYLFTAPAPWGDDHRELFNLYKDSNAGECPLVIDKSTPSCGNSRFGCWVCTVVTQDRAMDGLIESGHQWLVPLKEFRDRLYETTIPENKHKYRHEKGRLGQIKVFFDTDGNAKASPGPYKMEYRKNFLRRLLEIQAGMRTSNAARQLELITKGELEQIRVEWRRDPVEPQWDDPLPRIYAEVLGEQVMWQQADDAMFSGTEMMLLQELEQRDGVPKELPMRLLELEISMEGLARRSNLIARIGSILREDWGGRMDAISDKSAARVRADIRESEVKEFDSLYKKWAARERNAD